MKTGGIIETLEKYYPRNAAESWDNPGLQAGRRDKTVKKVLLALDMTEELIEEAIKEGAELIITHHPLLMSGLKKITTDDFLGRKVVRLIREDISHYAMHTNFDVITMGRIAGEYLGLTEPDMLVPVFTNEKGEVQGYGCIGNIKEQSVRELTEKIKKEFGLASIRIFGNADQIVRRAAVLPGSGKDFVKEALKKKAEVYISGDFGHHHGMDAVEEGLIVIDAGHYGLEHIFIDYMKKFLEEQFPELTIITTKSGHPFEVL